MDIDFNKIKYLQGQLNKLLEQRPEYKEYQKMIESELKKAGDNRHNRMAILENLLHEKRKELIASWEDFQIEINNLYKAIRKINE